MYPREASPTCFSGDLLSLWHREPPRWCSRTRLASAFSCSCYPSGLAACSTHLESAAQLASASSRYLHFSHKPVRERTIKMNFPRLPERWKRTFMCGRCGEFFDCSRTAEDAERIAAVRPRASAFRHSRYRPVHPEKQSCSPMLWSGRLSRVSASFLIHRGNQTRQWCGPANVTRLLLFGRAIRHLHG